MQLTDGSITNIESRVMCWSHMIRNVDNRLATVNAIHLTNLRSDIYILQLVRDR